MGLQALRVDVPEFRIASFFTVSLCVVTGRQISLVSQFG